MKLIGLTGGIASGKSTVSRVLRGLGLPVVDADVLARDVVGSGTFGLKAIAEIFGQEILRGEELDRAALRSKVFIDPVARLVLENITHPLIQWRASCEIQGLKEEGHPLIFYDAALIFEKNLLKSFDAIVVVHTSLDQQLKRLMARDKIEKSEAEKRLESQFSIAKKMAGSTYLIDNSGSEDETKRQVVVLVNKLEREQQDLGQNPITYPKAMPPN